MACVFRKSRRCHRRLCKLALSSHYARKCDARSDGHRRLIQRRYKRSYHRILVSGASPSSDECPRPTQKRLQIGSVQDGFCARPKIGERALDERNPQDRARQRSDPRWPPSPSADIGLAARIVAERLVRFRARAGFVIMRSAFWRRRPDRSRFREVTWRSKATAAVPSPLDRRVASLLAMKDSGLRVFGLRPEWGIQA